MCDRPLYGIDEYRKRLSEFRVDTWASGNGGATADQVRFNYIHPTQFFPHAVIARSDTVSPFEPQHIDAFESISASTPMGTLPFGRFIEESGMDGVLVIRRGRIVLEKYVGMRRIDAHIWWSVSKAVAALLVAILEDRRQLDVSRSIDFYLPELKTSGFAGTRVLDVLDMASGIDALEADDPLAHSDPQSAFGKFEASLGIQPKGASTPASPYHYVGQLQQHREPGRAFEYTSVNTFALGWLIEKLSGLPLHEVVRKEVWSRIGAQNDAFMLLAPGTGAPAIHGGISSTLRDLGRFGLLFTPSHALVCNEQLVSSDFLKKIQTGGRPEIFDKASGGSRLREMLGERPAHNTYQWDFVMADGDFFKGGFDGQGLYISPEQDLVVAYFGHSARAVHAVKYARQIALLYRSGKV